MKDSKKILITGGAGFIGGALIRNLLLNTSDLIFNLDKFGYASDLTGIEKISSASKRHKVVKLDLINMDSVNDYINFVKPDLIIHLACLLYTSPSPRDTNPSRMPSSA